MEGRGGREVDMARRAVLLKDGIMSLGWMENKVTFTWGLRTANVRSLTDLSSSSKAPMFPRGE